MIRSFDVIVRLKTAIKGKVKDTKVGKLLKKIRFCIKYVQYFFFPLRAQKVRYKNAWNKNADLKNPCTFDEKLMYLINYRYKDDPCVQNCIDKAELYNYYRNKGEKDILNELYGIYDNASQIVWERLPESFALKCNHGCGYNIIIANKKRESEYKIKKQLNKWMKQTYGVISGEIQYFKIPHKIICEKYLGDRNGNPPIDYKFYCCNGIVECVEVIIDRFKNYHYVLVDRNYNILPYGVEAVMDEKLSKSVKPDNFELFIETAERLAAEFEFVRVDLYEYQKRPILGEMTFFPMGGVNTFLTEEGQIWLGNKIKL